MSYLAYFIFYTFSLNASRFILQLIFYGLCVLYCNMYKIAFYILNRMINIIYILLFTLNTRCIYYSTSTIYQDHSVQIHYYFSLLFAQLFFMLLKHCRPLLKNFLKTRKSYFLLFLHSYYLITIKKLCLSHRLFSFKTFLTIISSIVILIAIPI